MSPVVMRKGLHQKHLYAAVLISSLLHGVLFVAPLLGTSSPSSGTAGADMSLMLSARLMPPTGGTAKTPTTAPVSAPSTPTANQPKQDHSSPAQENGFFAPGQLTRQPRPIDPVNLNIPESRLPTVHGPLILRLWINLEGQVIAVEAEPTDLPGEYVSAMAETLAGVRFAPGLVNGKPVGSIVRIEINNEMPAAPP